MRIYDDEKLHPLVLNFYLKNFLTLLKTHKYSRYNKLKLVHVFYYQKFSSFEPVLLQSYNTFSPLHSY